MVETTILKFDAMKLNTELAKEYLKSVNLRSIGTQSTYDNDICCGGSSDLNIVFITTITKGSQLIEIKVGNHNTSTNLSSTLCCLAKEIEKKAELFAQLEWLVRMVQPQDIKSCDIKLITQNLVYCSSICNNKNLSAPSAIRMSENTPLAALGFIGQMLVGHAEVFIESCLTTAAVCYLFTQLCHEVGLKGVTLAIVISPLETDLSYQPVDLHSIEDLQSACCGVITERADLDSAVDNLLASTQRYPWRLQKIYVQESIYESMKKTLAWKCKGSCDATGKEKMSSESFVYGNKTILCDFTGKQLFKNQRQEILVEAYRTTKELLSLLKEPNPYCISLWSNTISEANEIAFGANAPVVWLNGYGIFDGPLKASQSFYGLIEYKWCLLHSELSKQVQMPKTWLQSSVENRKDIIRRAIKSYNTDIKNKPGDEDNSGVIAKIEDALLRCQSDDFVEITNGKMCIGTVIPSVKVYQNIRKFDDWTELFAAMINGSGVIIANEGTKSTEQKKNDDLFQKFIREGLPINLLDMQLLPDNTHFGYYQAKVVYTSFGTIFAN